MKHVMSRPLLFGAVFASGFVASSAGATQQVYLDFASHPGNGSSTHVYTSSEQSQIRTVIDGYYDAFDFSFTLTPPAAGPFSTVTFNAPTSYSGGALVGGQAQTIDFRNLIKTDTARVNVGSLLGGFNQPPSTSANHVALASFVGAHELGHLQGLRHGDSYGPIGSGITTPRPGPAPYTPDYPGPTNATESGRNLMASPASVGQTLDQATGPVSFGAREAVKLAFNETPNVVTGTGGNSSTVAAQPLTLNDLDVPNTLRPGSQDYGKTFDVDAVAVTGSISVAGEDDFYSVLAPAGLLEVSLLTMTLPSPRLSNLDGILTVRDATGSPVNYYGTPAVSDDEFESGEATLIDLILPTAGLYYFEVNGFGSSTGGYELFAYTFAAVPEPGTGVLALVGLAFVSLRRRRTSRASQSTRLTV